MVYRSRAPLRVSFAGGGTDVSPYPETKGGAVLSTAITRFCHATLRPRRDGLVRIASQDYGRALTFPADRIPPADGNLDLLKGTVRGAGDLGSGCDILVRSDVAPGSGLGASSALVVAALAVLHAWQGGRPTGHELAEQAFRVERVDLGISGGRQDQYAAAFGGFNYIEFLPSQTVVHPLCLPRALLNELQYHLLLWYTGENHPARDITAAQVEAYRAGEGTVVDSLDELKNLAVAMHRAILSYDLRTFGRLLAEGWEHKKRLASGISTGRIDALYMAARSAGATGGKLLGSGGGGHILLFCPDGAKARVTQALSQLGGSEAPMEFCRQGVDVWEVPTGD